MVQNNKTANDTLRHTVHRLY